MEKQRHPFGLVLFCLVMILSGLISMIISESALLDQPRALDLIQKIPLHQHLFFYLSFDAGVLRNFFFAKLAVAILMVIAGISLLRLHLWALWLTRWLIIGLISLTFVNPYYPDYLVAVFLVWHSFFLFYLHHPEIENLCHLKGAAAVPGRIIDPIEKSRLAVLFGCLEMILALGLVRCFLWTTPLYGYSFQVPTELNLSLTITIPKIALLTVSIMLYAAGVMMISFRPLGRMLSILFCIAGFLLASASTFILNKPQVFINKLMFLIMITCSIVSSVFFFFLLTNPKVKDQFEAYKTQKPWARFLGTVGFGVFCILVLGGLQFSIDRFPSLFDTTAVQRIVKETEQWEDSNLRSQWEGIQQQVTMLLQRFKPESP